MENGKFEATVSSYTTYLVEKKKVSAATLSAYQTDLKKFHMFLDAKHGIEQIGDLNQSIVMSYLLDMKKNGKASSSISRRLSVIKNYLLFCYHMDLIDVNLAEHKYEVPKDEKKLPEVLTVEEVNIMLSQPDQSILGIRDKAMLEIMYSSGLKVNELLQLKKGDIDLKLKVIHCRNQQSKRILPLGAMAYDAVVDYLTNSRGSLESVSCEYLFLSYNGKRISRQGFWKAVKKYAAQAGIEKNISTSTFRHSFATHMIENGINKDVLKEALGNSSVASVQMYLDMNRKRQQS